MTGIRSAPLESETLRISALNPRHVQATSGDFNLTRNYPPKRPEIFSFFGSDPKLRLMKWLIVWLVSAIAIAFVIGNLNVPLYEHLITRGVPAKATVVELTPQNHGRVRYVYHVGGTRFERQDSPSPPNATGQVAVGESLIIYYDPLNPFLSVAGDPKPRLTNELIAIAMAALILPTLIVFILKSKEQEKRPNCSEQIG
jgi:hypothetical protein